MANDEKTKKKEDLLTKALGIDDDRKTVLNEFMNQHYPKTKDSDILKSEVIAKIYADPEFSEMERLFLSFVFGYVMSDIESAGIQIQFITPGKK